MSLAELYREHNEKVKFLMVYIREAHPVDGWKMGEHGIKDPQTIEDRRSLAKECAIAMQHGIKTYVDEMDDPVMTAYAAHPERLYLINIDGKVVFRGGLGPMGFDPSQLKQAIERELELRGTEQP